MSRLLILLLISGCASVRQNDKFGHLAVGYGISRVVTEVTGNQFSGCAVSILAGVGKEAVDSLTHTPEGMDIYATSVGGCTFSIPF